MAASRLKRFAAAACAEMDAPESARITAVLLIVRNCGATFVTGGTVAA